MAKELSVKQLKAKKIRLQSEVVKAEEKVTKVVAEVAEVDVLLLAQAEKLRAEADEILGESAVEEVVSDDTEEGTF